MDNDKVHVTPDELKNIDDEGGVKRNLSGFHLKLVAGIAICWTLFQLWYASPLPFILNFGIFIDLPARAIHLAFALVLCFLIYPSNKSKTDQPIRIYDYIFIGLSILATFYIVIDYEGLVNRQGILANINLLLILGLGSPTFDGSLTSSTSFLSYCKFLPTLYRRLVVVSLSAITLLGCLTLIVP